MSYILASAEPNMSLIILITGFVVVFAVLFLLIGIIWLYSAIVSAVQNKAVEKALKKNKMSEPVVSPAPSVSEPVAASGGDPDLQTVAVITAAVEAFYADGRKVRITGIRKSSSARSEWATAGLMESMPLMRSEGIL